MTTNYHYDQTHNPAGYNTNQLMNEIIASGLPTDVHINGSGYQGPNTLATEVDIIYNTALGPTDKTTLDNLITNHQPQGPRKPRPLYSIYADVGGMTGAQLTATWNDLDAGNPPKMALDSGPNASSIFTMQFLAKSIASLTATEKNEARQRLIAFYTQDNPKYLVNPPFAPGVNIPGDEPA